MNREDWNKLDDLLHQEGYGGYYDLLELLKGFIRSWTKEKFGLNRLSEHMENQIENLKTIHQATSMLSAIELTKKVIK